MEYQVRVAVPGDLESIVAIIESGRQYLKTQGLPQWQNGYGPNREEAAKDIERGCGYVLEVAGRPCGYASLIPGPEGSPPLAEGAWSRDGGHYTTIHRVALEASVRGSGLAATFLKGLIRAAHALGYQDIRIDTHPENVIMQKVTCKAGFTYRGVMQLRIPEGARWAYQLLLD